MPLAAETMGFWGWFFLLLIFIPLTIIWVFTLIDIFSRSDLSGWAKALWVVFVIILPLLGMLVYFIARPMTAEDVEAQEEYVRMKDFSEASDAADKLHKLAELRDKGDLSQEEFETQKARLLGGS
ncbi:MAG: SHOCT domain-containing protein [Actinomycetota bacterium]|nr:SHOCT domain-containing protein [Actinomycetota bacterium]